MQEIEKIGNRLKSVRQDINRFINKPNAIREVNSGLRTVESLYSEYGIEAFMKGPSDETTLQITKWLAGISKEDSLEQTFAKRLMHEIMDLASKKHRLPKRIAPWMVPIAKAIQKDQGNRFQLENATIQRYFACSPQDSAVDDLLTVARLDTGRPGERPPRGSITRDKVRWVSKHNKDIMEEHWRVWYWAQYQRATPIADGVRAYLDKVYKNSNYPPEFSDIRDIKLLIEERKKKPIFRIESEVNPVACGNIDKNEWHGDTLPQFEGSFLVEGVMREGTLNVNVYHKASGEVWNVWFALKGVRLATGISYGEGHSLQDALDIAVEKGFTPVLKPMAEWPV